MTPETWEAFAWNFKRYGMERPGEGEEAVAWRAGLVELEHSEAVLQECRANTEQLKNEKSAEVYWRLAEILQEDGLITSGRPIKRKDWLG